MALGGIRVTQAMSEKDVALMSGRSGSKQEGIGEWEDNPPSTQPLPRPALVLRCCWSVFEAFHFSDYDRWLKVALEISKA